MSRISMKKEHQNFDLHPQRLGNSHLRKQRPTLEETQVSLSSSPALAVVRPAITVVRQ